MKRFIAAALLAWGAGRCWGAESPPAAPDFEFTAWLVNRADTLQIPFPVINMVTVSMQGRSISQRVIPLAQLIAHDDFKFSRYLGRLEENQKKYGRISPFDREVLAAIVRYELPRKRDAIGRLERFARGLGIKPAKETSASAASAWKDALPKNPGRRYNPEWGGEERLDPATREWVPEQLKPAKP